MTVPSSGSGELPDLSKFSVHQQLDLKPRNPNYIKAQQLGIGERRVSFSSQGTFDRHISQFSIMDSDKNSIDDEPLGTDNSSSE